MALLAWQRHLWSGQDAFAFLWRRTHTEQQVLSPPPIVVCCRLGHLAAALLEKKKQQTLDISRGTWPTMVSSFHTATANGSWSLSLSQWTGRPYLLVNVMSTNDTLNAKRPGHGAVLDTVTASKPLAKGGGLIFEGKCIFENKPLPSLGHVYCWKRGGAYFREDVVIQ